MRVVEKVADNGNKYLQFQKRSWNPKLNEGKGGSELSVINTFESELDSNYRQLSEAYLKMGKEFQVKWLKQVEKAVSEVNASTPAPEPAKAAKTKGG